ncbi:ATPase/histidine kinase/DNA gyrase B/HSP90 domain protein [Sphingobacterium spiritivorum ATCC 33300]|uniref:histidine kinase n=1 Tax=Sphingobacterium spiritivorum ATCC 33300 TaxID=525372 RepID=C2FVG6_SPHSI|nr:HAMP domain-containing sensor histidine kinase [Sphingobacterium spiritivorum]EEI93024.1 ATPase/histidine kinase/DNA gyrase B/HSP90 domain protein [Sphingobacterium spiritivorum ATCC 33300]QQS96176.1 HAMP domain-containing histidine kinase [Sphingobacterium spiritivorum]
MEETNLIRLLVVGIVVSKLIVAVLFVLFYRKNKQLSKERQSLVDANAEINRYVGRIEEQNRALVEAEQFKAKIFSVVSHDLRVPVSTFQTLLSFSRVVEIPPEEIRKTLIKIGSELDDSSKMLDEVLIWAAEQMTNEKIILAPLSAYERVEEAYHLFYERISFKQLIFMNNIPKDFVLMGNKKIVDLIIRNLISNAVKFSLSGQEIVVGLSSSPANHILYVQDNGVGMSEEQVASLQTATIKSSSEGTFKEKGAGIGLVLCYDFAHRLGWNINVSSKEGSGSIFQIQIPVHVS